MPPEHIPLYPSCFVADTDSTNFVIDTGTNRIIVNDASLLCDFQAMEGGIKGVGGNPTKITGTGSLPIQLPWDDQTTSQVTLKDAVLVPSSP